jgi:2-iminobutanoate/2-iminopropanoate deaminase
LVGSFKRVEAGGNRRLPAWRKELALIEVLETGLKPMQQPFSWAIRGGGLIFTAHGPVDADGAIVGDDITAQARLTFRNLMRTAAAAGATADDIAQVLIYMKEPAHMAAIDAVYRDFFTPPYPNRSSVVVKDFVDPRMLIEIVAYLVAP